jgi:prephenate dehydratase
MNFIMNVRPKSGHLYKIYPHLTKVESTLIDEKQHSQVISLQSITVVKVKVQNEPRAVPLSSLEDNHKACKFVRDLIDGGIVPVNNSLEGKYKAFNLVKDAMAD